MAENWLRQKVSPYDGQVYVIDIGVGGGGTDPRKDWADYNPPSAPAPGVSVSPTQPRGNIYRDADGVIRNNDQDPGNPAVDQPDRRARMGYDYGSGLTGDVWGGGSISGFSSSGSRSGGGMPTVAAGPGTVRTQYANLAGSVWNNPIPTSSVGFASQGGAYADQIARMSPNVAGPERTLYDKYSSILQDPASIANDPAYQFMLQQAQQASGRQLAAGRMSKSGNAAIQAAKVATGTAGNYLRDLSSIYGQGAQLEGQRWGQEVGAGLEAYKAHVAGLLGASQSAAQAGQTANYDAANALKAREIDLARVNAGIQTPGEVAQANFTSQLNAYNNPRTYDPMTTAGMVSYGNYATPPRAPDLSSYYGFGAPAFGSGFGLNPGRI